MLSLALDTSELRKFSELPTELALREAASFLDRLVREPAFLEAEIRPLREEARKAGNWYVAHSNDAPDGAYSLQVFVWPPGSGTAVHDHFSWGAFRCVTGSLLGER